MRMSARAAAIAVAGVRWQKYNCTRSTYGIYSAGAPSVVQQGEVGTDVALACYTSFNFNQYTGTFTNAGSPTTVGASNPGTGYSASGNTLNIFSISASSYLTHSRQTSYIAGSYTVYSKGSYIENVKAKEGVYPDAKNGYEYVTKFSDGGKQYTVMRNGSSYYCYCLAEE